MSIRSSLRRVLGKVLPRLILGVGLIISKKIVLAQDYSAPAILQNFENSYKTIQNRTSDIFMAGYGTVYTPPPGRADQSNFSVGYDQYDRFDLGSPGNPTLYGTETGLKSMISQIHKMGGSAYVDLVWNHSGFSDLGTSDGQGHSFYNAGGY